LSAATREMNLYVDLLLDPVYFSSSECNYHIFILDLIGLSPDGVLDMVTALGDPKFESRQEQERFLFYRTSRTVMGPLSVFHSVGTGLLCRGKRLVREVDYSLPSRAEVKTEWRCTSTASLAFRARIGIALPLFT